MVFLFLKRMKINHFYRLCLKNALRKQLKVCGETYFSSYYLFEAVKYLSSARSNSAKQALIHLCAGRSKKAVAYFYQNKKVILYLTLKAMYVENILPETEKAVKKESDNIALLAELAVLYYISGDKSKCRLCLENIPEKVRSPYIRARKFHFETYFYLNDGDMLSASSYCSRAIGLYRRCNASFEEGRAYLLMGIIYRAAVIADVSELMLRSAKNIFENLNARADICRVLGNLGMLMATQSRFEEAQAYYDEAQSICRKLNRQQSEAEIINQLGLMNLMKNNLEEAQKLCSEALEKHSASENKEGIAFSKEILGNIAWQQKEFSQALQYAFEAKNLYKEIGNMSAYLENLYTMSLSLFEQNQYDEAEKHLREIIKTSEKHQTNFHRANAYNLLGLIYLRKQDYRRAKGLFQQSLNLEQASNRLGGIAADYANIGLIESYRGNKEQAEKTLLTAIEYAEANGDDDIVSILKKQIETL